MDLNKKSDQGDAPSGANNQPKKSLLTWVMIFFAVPIMALVESAKGLHKRVYERGFAGPFNIVIGILAALGAGIGTGYYEGWLNSWSWFAWVPAGLAATVATYAYLWPLVYLVLLKPIQTASKELWDAVPRRDHWFTDLLTFVSRFAVVGAAGFEAWHAGGVALANLTTNGWGFFAYVGAFAWAAFVGVVIAAFAWSIFTTTVYGICAGSGLLLSWALLPTIQGWFAHFGLVLPVWGYAGAAAGFLLWISFLFPLVHLIASHGLRIVRDLARDVYTSAYEKTVGEYEGVFTQLVNLWTAYHLGSLTLALLGALGFVLGGWQFYAVPAVVAVLSYLIVGQIFRAIGNKGLGIVAAAHGARWAVYALAGFSLPWIIGGTAVAAALTFFVAYPLTYVLVRLVGQFILNNKVAGYLVVAHDKACDAAEQLLTEVARARRNTYGDESWFAKLFSHALNIAALLPVWFYATGFLGAVGMTGWTAWGLLGLALVLSYLLVGRLLALTHNYVVGGSVALVGAVVTGVIAFAHLPWGLWSAIPAGLLGGVVIAGWLFPIAYVFSRFLVNLVDGIVPLFSKLIEPLVRNVHEFCWRQVSGLWTQFREAYRLARDWFKPTWASISKAWSEAWQSVKDSWESVKRR
jgi:hypothetical protein